MQVVSARRRRIRKSEPYDLVHVIFNLPDRDVARVSIAVGPCIPPHTRKRPWVGITNQEPGDFRALESLFSIIVGDSTHGPWVATRVEGPGRLDTFSDTFVSAMADINRATLARIDAAEAIDEEHYRDIWGPELDIAERWLPMVDWRRKVSLRYVQQRVGYLCAVAREMQDRGRTLYCWSGPGFNPWLVRLKNYGPHVTLRDAD